jgi:hypothetical protein
MDHGEASPAESVAGMVAEFYRLSRSGADEGRLWVCYRNLYQACGYNELGCGIMVGLKPMS